MKAAEGIRTRRFSGADAAYVSLRDDIVAGVLRPGDRLTEPLLTERLGVSRTPVREAIRRLTVDRLLSHDPSDGVVVSSMSDSDMSEVYAIRARLEGLLARDACGRVTTPAERELRKILMLMDLYSDDADYITRLGREFHLLIGQLADNPWCSKLLDRLHLQIDRYRILSARKTGRPAQVVEEHREILLALLGSDPAHAERVMHEHIMRGSMSASDVATQRR